MKNLFTICIVFLMFIPLFAQNEPQLGRNPLKEVIKAMTLEEKAQLVVGMGMKMPGTNEFIGDAPTVGQTNDKVPGAAGTTFAIPRLGIPSIVVADGPAGLRISPLRDTTKETFYCTAFPIATLLASSWDTDLVKKIGEAIGNEVKEYGVDILLAPALNIQRNSLGGRNFEYYSEDPVVAGKMAAAMVKGIQSKGVGTSIKHFAANNQETNRNTVDTKVNERTLREIYLRGFEIAIKDSEPWTVMSSYNKINGISASENGDLLTNVLRNDWKYRGFVMTDWFGGTDAVAQMNAGNDLLMPGVPSQVSSILKGISEDKLKEEMLNKNVERILNIIMQTSSFKKYQNTNKPNLKKNADLARSLAAEGMILLKNNDNVLPLKKATKIAVLGNGSYEFISGGTGSGDVNEAYTISLQDGLNKQGFKPNLILKENYEKYIKDERGKQEPPKFFFMGKAPLVEMPLSNEQLEIAVKEDVAVITIGRTSGEFVDRKVDVDFNLTKQEYELIKNTSDIFHQNNKKVVVILNIGGTVETVSWRDLVDGILLAWQPGQEGGNAVTDVLSGKVNPSGKLATTFPEKYEDEPTSTNFPGIELEKEMKFTSFGMPLGKKSEVTYEEGIFVGYRFFNTFNVKPAFEFGFGKSYTNFEYSKIKLNKSKFDGTITATVAITNKGKVPGKEVVQLYISAPNENNDKPALELKAFAKTKTLSAGVTETVTFKLESKDLASFDPEASAWMAEDGKYTIKIGASSSDIRQKATFKVPNKFLVERVSKSLIPVQPVVELKNTIAKSGKKV